MPTAFRFSVADLVEMFVGAELAGDFPTLPFVMISSVIDLTVAAAYTFPSPQPAGFFFVPSNSRFVFTQTNGVWSTAPTVKAGNNATHDNVINSTNAFPTNLDFNQGAPCHSTNLSNGRGKMVDMGTVPIDFTVTIAATGTGGFAAKGQVYMTGYLIPV